MARGDREWDALDVALHDMIPACENDIRFVLDTPTDRDLEDMASICSSCPLRLRRACGAYADATRPPGTFWAGRFYPAREA